MRLCNTTWTGTNGGMGTYGVRLAESCIDFRFSHANEIGSYGRVLDLESPESLVNTGLSIPSGTDRREIK